MQAVKKESVYAGNGVSMRMKDGRLRISVPCSKRWRGGMFLTLYLSGIVVSNGFVFLPPILSGWLTFLRNGEGSHSSFWFSLIIISFWLMLAGLVVYSFLWFLLGYYVLEIGNKDVRIGRSLLGIDFLSTHDVADLRRIRFSPELNMEGGRYNAFRTRTSTRSGKIFRPGRYSVQLDYGLSWRQVLRVALEESQVRTLKRLLRSHCDL